MRRSGLVIAFLFLLAPAGASAATQHASPAGKVVGACTASADPCELQYAISQAAVDETIELAAGTYTRDNGTSYLLDRRAVLAGAAGTRPLLKATAPNSGALTVTGGGATVKGVALEAPATATSVLNGNAATVDLSDVVIDSPGPCVDLNVGTWEDVTLKMTAGNEICAILGGTGTLRRVSITAPGAGATGVQAGSATTFLDTTVTTGGVGIRTAAGLLRRVRVAAGSVGIRTTGATTLTDSFVQGIDAVVQELPSTLTARNVTAVGTMRGFVVAGEQIGMDEAALTATNVIARGATPADDVVSQPGGGICLNLQPCAPGAADLSFSNVRSTPSGGLVLGDAVQTADPQFVSATDLHLAPGSPAIDAGTDTGTDASPSDIDGEARRSGAKVDIGADEVQVTATPTPTPTPSPTPAPDTTAPVISKAKAVRRGKVRFVLSEAARVRITAVRKRGRKFRPYGRTTVVATPGVFSVRLRFGGRKLKPGRYRVTLRATDASGNRSRKVRVSLRVRPT